MADLVIHPTKKWIRFQYTLVTLVFAVAVGVYINALMDRSVTGWVLVLPALLFLWPAVGHLRRRFTRVTVTGDKLRYETGILSKSTRTIQLSKVQDVRVDQTLGQRLVNIGNLSIETAGETSRLTVHDIDDPTAVADEIMDAAQGHPQKQAQPKRKEERA